MMLVDRKLGGIFLLGLRNTATEHAVVEGLSQSLKRAYLNLADAADSLDAMIVRTECEVKEEES